MNFPYHDAFDGDGQPIDGFIFKITMMCYREVALRRIRESDTKDLKLCADCHQPSQYVVVELCGKEREAPFKRVWPWCGICCIGA